MGLKYLWTRRLTTDKDLCRKPLPVEVVRIIIRYNTKCTESSFLLLKCWLCIFYELCIISLVISDWIGALKSATNSQLAIHWRTLKRHSDDRIFPQVPRLFSLTIWRGRPSANYERLWFSARWMTWRSAVKVIRWDIGRQKFSFFQSAMIACSLLSFRLIVDIQSTVMRVWSASQHLGLVSGPLLRVPNPRRRRSERGKGYTGNMGFSVKRGLGGDTWPEIGGDGSLHAHPWNQHFDRLLLCQQIQPWVIE
jgi:hypothetical protein